MTDEYCELLALDLETAESIRRSLPSAPIIREAAERAKGLSDPTRLLIAVALSDGSELCVCDLAWVCAKAEKTVSHHARELRGAGLAESRREGKMVMYSLTEAGRQLLRGVLVDSGAPA